MRFLQVAPVVGYGAALDERGRLGDLAWMAPAHAPRAPRRRRRARARSKASPKTRDAARRGLPLDGADPSARTSPFERVWQIVPRIPRGKVAPYGQISRAIDRRLTPVGVGWALRAVRGDRVPWHRVVNRQGCVSTDGEHPGLQRAILESEGVSFGNGDCIDLAQFGWRRLREPAGAPATTRSARAHAHARQSKPAAR
jgi:methylated-DNA-protein-cysteine methyltransferase-like protein